MTARPECGANRVADALVLALKKISAVEDAGQWLTTPRAVTRGFFVDDLQAPRPAFYVAVAGLRNKPETVPAAHEGTIVLEVTGLSEAPANQPAAEAELNRLMSDAIRAVSLDEYLADADGVKTVLFAQALSYEPNVEIMRGTGLGAATLIVEASFRWTHGTP